MKTAYVVIPYSHPMASHRAARFEIANRAAAHLIGKGYNAFSPISHSHPIAKYMGNANDSKFWCDVDEHWQRQCDELFVVCAGGWRESKGVKREIALAEKIGQKVTYLDPVYFTVIDPQNMAATPPPGHDTPAPHPTRSTEPGGAGSPFKKALVACGPTAVAFFDVVIY